MSKILGYVFKKTITKIKSDAYRDAGETLCCLVGNKMLENMEDGKKLGEQLSDYLKWIRGKAGITLQSDKALEGKE
jgi:hypothetical protein